jgi:hypothetical protein
VLLFASGAERLNGSDQASASSLAVTAQADVLPPQILRADRIDALLEADQGLEALYNEHELVAAFLSLLPPREVERSPSPWYQYPDTATPRRMVEIARGAAEREQMDGDDSAVLAGAVRFKKVYQTLADAWGLAVQAQARPFSTLTQTQGAAGEVTFTGGISDYDHATSILRRAARTLMRSGEHERLATRIDLVSRRDALRGEVTFRPVLRGNLVVLAANDSPPQVKAPTAAAPNTRFGVVDAYENPEGATELGVGWERIKLDDGVEWLDGEVAAGREPVGLLLAPNARRRVPPGLYLPFDDPANVWGQFVLAHARQFHQRVHTWIVGNEPDIWDRSDVYYTWAGTAEDYYQFLKVASLALKSTDTSSRVLIGGQSYWWDEAHGRELYLKQVLDAAVRDTSAPEHGWYFDGVVLHLYSTPADLYRVPMRYRKLLAHYGLEREIWIGETNAVPWNVPGQELPRAEFRVSLDEQASYVIQASSYAVAANVDRIGFYKMEDVHTQAEPYGLFRKSPLTPRPAAKAFQTVARYFRDVRNAELHPTDSTMSVTMRTNTALLTVAWASTARDSQLRVSALASHALLVDRFGTSQRIEPIDGAYVLTLTGATANTAPGQPDYYPVGGAPVILVQQQSTSEARVFLR